MPHLGSTSIALGSTPLDTGSLDTGSLDTGSRLNLEWSRLRNRPDALSRATSWQLLDDPVRDLDQILTAIGFRQPPSTAAEARLRELVVIAACDDLAGRIVVQRLVPGLLAVVSKRRRAGGGADVFDELLGAAWVTIRTFNPARRPGCLAAALISDADYRAFRSQRRRRRLDVVTLDEHVAPVDTHDQHPCDELSALFRDAIAAGVPEADIDLLRRLVDAPTAKELARQLLVTPRTIRNRRDRITDRLRAVAVAA